jgi:hypothetical protein
MRNAGYLSSNSNVMTLGLGKDPAAIAVRIYWPSGVNQELRNILAGKFITVIEGRTEFPQ